MRCRQLPPVNPSAEPRREGLDENMYQKFFGLRESPFNVNPDPRYLYLTKQIQEALAGLTYGIQNRKGFILLTGKWAPERPRCSIGCSTGCTGSEWRPPTSSIRSWT